MVDPLHPIPLTIELMPVKLAADREKKWQAVQRAISTRHAAIGATGKSEYSRLNNFRCACLCP